MGKTLAETAAEILNISTTGIVEAAGVVDLGGATTDNPAGDNVGSKAAAVVASAAKPTTQGDAKTVKQPPLDNSGYSMEQEDGEKPTKTVAVAEAEKMDDEEEEEDEEEDMEDEEMDEELDLSTLSEEELDELLSSLSEEELAALEEELNEEDAAEDLSDEEVQEILSSLSEEELAALEEAEQVDEAKPVMKKKVAPKMEEIDVKELVKSNMGSVLEDVDALFNGESLSEEFRTKASTIFGAAVQSRVETVVNKVMERNEQIVAEQVEQIRSSLSEQVDTYLNYVVEQWMEQNQVAIDSGIRSEIASDFISGLKNLFTEHYIEVPEEKVDLVEELAEQIVDLEEVINEQANDVVAVTAKLNEALKNETVRKICEGLTEVQIGKMKSLAEGVEFTTEGEYFDKLAVIRENYFPTKKLVSEVKKVESETSEEQPEVEGRLGMYVNAITKTLPKF